MKFTTTDWDDVRDFYKGLPNMFQPMVTLIDHIADVGYSKHLFPVTSVQKLRIGRYANYEMGDAELTVDWNTKEKEFEFHYYESPGVTKPWVRKCSKQEIKVVFDRIVCKQLLWFKNNDDNKACQATSASARRLH